MSNPEYENEKNMLVPVAEMDSIEGNYRSVDVYFVQGDPHVARYIDLAQIATFHGLDGMVIGAPSEKNHITNEEIKIASIYAGPDMLVLLPGVGEQGGEAGSIWQHFAHNKVIVNVGRSLMLPNGSESTPDDQATAAKHYQEMLNDLRSLQG